MARNVEIKARASNFRKQEKIARALARSEPTVLQQTDTFFTVANGRLKMREMGSRAELIYYQRPDVTGAKESTYLVVRVINPALLREALGLALGVRGQVRKLRRVYQVGQTRIHFDEVEKLGTFIELEVVLREGEDVAWGEEIANDLRPRLGICDDDLISGAYIDLLPDSE